MTYLQSSGFIYLSLIMSALIFLAGAAGIVLNQYLKLNKG